MVGAQARDEKITGTAALIIVLFMLPGIGVAAFYPQPTLAEPTSLVAYLAAHRTALLASSYLAALGWSGVLCVFAGGLWAILSRAEGGSGVWSIVAFGACIATAVAIGVAITFWGVVIFRAPAIDASLASVLYDAGAFANLMTAFPNAVYTLAAAIVIRRTSVLPQWVGHGALAVAAVHLGSAACLARVGPFGPWGVLPSLAPLAHTAWLAAVAWVLLRR